MALNFGRLATDVLTAIESTPPKVLVDPFAHASLADAYTVQHEVANQRVASGDARIGYKVGCTSARIQAQIGIAHPISGTLLESHQLESPAKISREDFAGLAVEGELAVVLNCDPQMLPRATDAVRQTIRHVMPVIELHHFDIPTTSLTAPVLVANNAMHAGFIHAQNTSLQPLRQASRLRIQFNAKTMAVLNTRELESTILNALTWLRNELTAQEDVPTFEPPVIVLCGSVAALIPITAPTAIEVTLENAGTVCCEVR